MLTTHGVSEEEALVAELELHGIRYLSRQTPYQAVKVRPPAQLIADLVRQPSARVREALISLFLARPQYSGAALAALARLSEDQALTLRLFYSAAVLLEVEHRDALGLATGDGLRPLPDLFSAELGLPPGDAPIRDRITALAHTHQERTGVTANWAGTYEGVACKLLRRWEMERQWRTAWPSTSACSQRTTRKLAAGRLPREEVEDGLQAFMESAEERCAAFVPDPLRESDTFDLPFQCPK
jgi:hypothetical protein